MVFKSHFLKISVRRNNGSAPSHWRAGSGSVARKALQNLEQLKLVEKVRKTLSSHFCHKVAIA